MLTVYPFASGSLYTASYAISTSFATSASYFQYVFTASNAATVLYPTSGSEGKGVCILNTQQYNYLLATGLPETCKFS